MAYEHLRVVRDEPINPRKRRPFPGFPRPADARLHGFQLKGSLSATVQLPVSEGFDNRRLLRINVVEGFRPEGLEVIPGLSVVSQEAKSVALLFSSAQALADVDRRLTLLARDGNVTYANLLLAINGFDAWTALDRTGAALAQLGLPDAASSIVDVELWPLERADERRAMLLAFDRLLEDSHIERLDMLDRDSLIMYKLRVSERTVLRLLNYRDVRLVDLPPSFGFTIDAIRPDVNALGVVAPLAEDAPGVCILDTGIAAGHPLLAPAIGETVNFVAAGELAADADGHGTRVAGLALYGGGFDPLPNRFEPKLRIFAGKVFANDGNDETKFVEKSVEEAVQYFVEEYDCKVFCLAYGDRNKVYDGRHIRGLAYTLDRLTRELGVLFVVPTGNLSQNEIPEDALEAYPHYLSRDEFRLLDPATALNAITVGGIAEFEADANAQRHPGTIESMPVARRHQPSPFTRRGLSIGGALKPDFVSYGGNVALQRGRGNFGDRRLGVISTSNRFAEGVLFDDACGTSFAAPQVAHLAGNILRFLPTATANTLRAVLGAHARIPGEAELLLSGDQRAKLALCGFGKVDSRHLFESADQAVTLLSEDAIIAEHHHFYELPTPDDFWAGPKRTREISVALAYSPAVKTTRIGYRAVKLSFNVVRAESLEQVSGWFNSGRVADARKMAEATPDTVNATDRSKGTLQCATWTYKKPARQRVFVVVTRQDQPWGDPGMPEPYSLVVTFRDLANAEANLYIQVRQQLRQREQVREQLRVRNVR
jgi:hypothetical protein